MEKKNVLKFILSNKTPTVFFLISIASIIFLNFSYVKLLSARKKNLILSNQYGSIIRQMDVNESDIRRIESIFSSIEKDVSPKRMIHNKNNIHSLSKDTFDSLLSKHGLSGYIHVGKSTQRDGRVEKYLNGKLFRNEKDSSISHKVFLNKYGFRISVEGPSDKNILEFFHQLFWSLDGSYFCENIKISRKSDGSGASGFVSGTIFSIEYE